MDTRYLIDAVVRQTTVLIAQLSTAAGIRAPLAHIADQIFVDLSRQIEAQGVSRKVAADMFGIALRTYQKKVERLSESASDRGTTLWQAVLELVENEPGCDRERVLARFAKDGEDNVIAVLSDLVGSGLLFSSGRGATSMYRPASEADRRTLASREAEQAIDHLVWLVIYRAGPIDVPSLVEKLGADQVAVEHAAKRLVADGRATLTAKGELEAMRFYVPVGASHGWEAAVFDHYQAVVTSITRKLARATRSSPSDEVGGGTLTFEICEGHPDEAEVRALLARTRRDVNELWDRVEARNEASPIPDDRKRRVTFYYGQSTDIGDGLDD
jgi:hypothetical protein